MGCAGNGDIRTPNLDRLAEDGVRFDEFYCASPVCSPARASIVTGKMPSCHGVLDWIEGGNVDTEKYPEMAGHPRFSRKDQPIEYLEGHKTYIEELAANGYVCGLSGKWHLGNNAEKKKGCLLYTSSGLDRRQRAGRRQSMRRRSCLSCIFWMFFCRRARRPNKG